MTPVSGRMLEIQAKLKEQKDAKKNSKDPSKLLAGDERKPPKKVLKAKAKSKAKASSKSTAAGEAKDDKGKIEREIHVLS